MSENKSHIEEKINRLYSDKLLGKEAIKDLETWLDNATESEDLSVYFSEKWEATKTSDVNEANQTKRLHLTSTLWNLQFYKNVAAILLLPLIGALLFVIVNQKVADTQLMTVRTELGDRAHFFLPDGTEVHMNALSTLSYNLSYGVNQRNVQVTGEVYFDVFKNPSLPFVVSSDSITVEALGTQFMVRNYLDEPVVRSSLLEGKIKVESTDEGMVLVPGESVEYNKAASVLTKKRFDLGMGLAWTNGSLIFKDDTMEDVCRKIEHWYGVKVVCNTEDFSGKTFSLRLRKEETLYNLLAIMSEVLQLNYRMNDDNLIITKKRINN
jgi:ferric-dicitrate binding protein FerR (iron transport regulator)